MRSKTIHYERTTPADADTVWRLLADSRTWPDWTPIDEHTPVSDGRDDHTGEVRIFKNGRVTVREEVVEVRPLQRFSYVLLDGLPLRDYRADIDLAETAATGTRITWHTNFRPKLPGTGWIYRRALNKATGQFIDGLVSATRGVTTNSA